MKCFMHIFKNKIRGTLISVAILTSLSPALSFAFGMGGLQLDSTLNQKLDASIELIGVQENEAESIVVDIAPAAIYERMGIERDPILKKLKFSLQKTPEGVPYIHVFTDEVITEPFVNFLIELNWSNGRLLREFTLLLDPPVLLDEKPAAVEAPQADIPPTFTVTTDSPGEIPETIKASKIPDPELEEDLDATSDDESDAEINEVFEKILASESLDNTENLSEETNKPVETIEEAKAPQSTSLVYEEVKKNEILWHIAEKMRPDNISVEQMMLALQRENPNAFFGDNVSFLKAGAVLRIEDTSTLNQISVEDAIEEIARQHQSWLDYRSERQARNAVAAESAARPEHGTDTSISAPEVVASNEDNQSEARLKLVSPIEEANEDSVTQTNAVLEAATEKLSQLKIELAIATEAVEAGKHEKEELLNRLSALEEQMSAMQSLIQLKDAELQRLQGDTTSVGEQEFLKPITVDTQVEDSVPVTENVTESHGEHDHQPSLLRDPITIATGIFAILILSLLVWFVWGRKTKTVETEELVYSDDKQQSLDELFPEESKDDDLETSIIKFNESKAESQESEVGVEPLTDISFEHTEMLDSNESLLDPIAEADVYLTYEKYEKAELLLRDAIESDPDRQELKLKLLEVYALSRNIEQFDKQAEELFAAIGGEEENVLWQHAQLMAKDVATVSPLFVGDDSKNKAELSTIEKAVSVSWSPEQVTEFDADQERPAMIDTELEIEESTETKSESELEPAEPENEELEAASSTSEQASEEVSDGEAQDPESKAENIVSDEELEKAMDVFSDSALDKEWDEATGDEVNEIVNEAIENAAIFSSPANKASAASSDTSMFLLSDEVGTKLDLAKAYIEMGDQEGAFDLLGEVLEEGTDQQKNEAKELMESNSV